MSAGTRAPQASRLGHPAQGAARAPLRADAKVALAPQATAPPALRCRTLRSARLQRSTARISESSAALQIRLRGRRLQNAAHSNSIGAPWPLGQAGADSQIEAVGLRKKVCLHPRLTQVLNIAR